MAFKRKTELFVGIFKDDTNSGSGGYLIDNLDYEFDITRSTEFYKDSATFTIYNPNEETINEIMTRGVSVIFKAGYETEGMGIFFVGQIATTYPEEEENGVTNKIVLICNSQRGAHYPLQRTMLRANVEAGRSYYDVLKLIADYVGVPLSGAEVLKDKILERPYMVSGDVRSAVKMFVAYKLRVLGGKVIISNNEMIYLDKDYNANFYTAYLTYKTGLISAKKVRDERYQSSEDAFSENQEYYLGVLNDGDDAVKEWKKKKAENEAKIQPRNIVEFRSLVNPSIEVGKPVFIDARRRENDSLSVLGKFYVMDMHIQGDNFGGQYQMECRAEEK